MTSIFNEESGQGMVEYGLILVLVSLAAIVALGSMGGGPIRKMYDDGGKEIIEALDKK